MSSGTLARIAEDGRHPAYLVRWSHFESRFLTDLTPLEASELIRVSSAAFEGERVDLPADLAEKVRRADLVLMREPRFDFYLGPWERPSLETRTDEAPRGQTRE